MNIISFLIAFRVLTFEKREQADVNTKLVNT